jgi:hypothetical protein
MSQVNIESAEIDLQPVEEQITDFSDNESIAVEHINFEFEQSSKLHGTDSKLTIFNDTYCYQSIKNKHRRKYKFRLDLAYLDPRPFRVRNIAWKWLNASLALWSMAAIIVFAGWFDSSSVTSLGLFSGIIIAALFTLLLFLYRCENKVYFRSQYGKARLLEMIYNNPNKGHFHDFIKKFVAQIKASKKAKSMDQSKLLAAELKDLRRLKDEIVVSDDAYEKAKRLIFKHKAFKAAD